MAGTVPVRSSFEVDYDPDLWLPVPTRFAADDEQRWVATQAALRRERGFVETPDTGTLDQYFHNLAAVARTFAGHDGFWALLPDDAPGFLGVVLDVRPAEGRFDDLVDVVAAPTPNQYEPAVAQAVEAAGLGDGVHVSRHDVDDDSGVFASLYYVFRAAGSDLVVSTQSYDLVLLDWAAPFIRDFVDSIAPAASPS